MRHMDIYDDVGREAFHRAANLVRTFVEDYHERLEERFLFPEFERRNRQAALVGVLRRQHQAGRALTDIIQRNSIGAIFQRSDARQELVRACEAFIRMYRPHEAREDTVLFPELHDILSAKQLRELGERFEEEEDRLFGEGGFQNTVGQVAEIERQLGTLDLDQFTPRLTGSHGS
jgi:hemerythrin-like domain-containing protein